MAAQFNFLDENESESSSEHSVFTPLAERCRPQKLAGFVGHEDIVGPNSALRREIEKSRLKSMIFWGPPGVGKTTLARILANEVAANFVSISAVTSGVKELRDIIDGAQKLRRFKSQNTILFIDEIHRFNKAQQDALLHAVESGVVVLIGATTENPSFEVNSPLLSRAQVYQLKPLTAENIQQLVMQAISTDPELCQKNIEVADWESLHLLSGGDGRRAINILEKAIEFCDNAEDLQINTEILQKAAQQNAVYYDKNGENHYDIISAFIKSLRGSDPDAALYWMARMLNAGEDPKFIARRMLILAAEDIGNADPQALGIATNCFQAVTFVGMPEARIILSQAATYLATTPKSNAAYLAINQAMEDAKKYSTLPVPLKLRNAPTTLMKDLGYGNDYQYAHDFPNHFKQINFLPDIIKNKVYYSPTDQGREGNFRTRLKQLWKGVKKYTD